MENDNTDESNLSTKTQLPSYEPFPRYTEHFPIELKTSELEAFLESYEYMVDEPGYLYQIAYLRAHGILSRWRGNNDPNVCPDTFAISDGDKIAVRYMKFVLNKEHIESIRQKNYVKDFLKNEIDRKQKALEAMTVWVDCFVATPKSNCNVKLRLTKETNDDRETVYVIIDKNGNRISINAACDVLDEYDIILNIPHEQKRHYQRKLSLQVKNIAKQEEEKAKNISRQQQKHMIHSSYQSMVHQIMENAYSFEKFEQLLHQIYSPFTSKINGYHVTTSFIDVSRDMAVDPLVYNVVKDGISGKRHHDSMIDALKQSTNRNSASGSGTNTKSNKRSRRTPDTKMCSTGVIAKHHLETKKVEKENQARIQEHKQLNDRITIFKSIVKDLDKFAAKDIDFQWQAYNDSCGKDHKLLLKTLCRMYLPKYGWGKLGTTTVQEKIKLLKAANCPGSKTGIFERKGAMIQEISVDEKSYSDNDAEITQLIENEENEQHDHPQTKTNSVDITQVATQNIKDQSGSSSASMSENKDNSSLSPCSKSTSPKQFPESPPKDQKPISIKNQSLKNNMHKSKSIELSSQSRPLLHPVKYERIVDSDTPSKTDKLRTKKLKPDQNLDATATAMMQQKQYFSQIYMNSLSLPLPQQFRMRVQCIFNQPCNNDVQGKREVTSLNGHSVNLSSMQRLQPATDEYGNDLKTQAEREARYLNDEIVNYYFWMLEIQNRNETYVQHNSLHSPRCAFFSSFLMKKILYDSDKSPRAYNYML